MKSLDSKRMRRVAMAALVMLAATAIVACHSSLIDQLGGQLQVKQPTFSLEPGTYDHDIEVRLVTETDQATIFYTTDASDPKAGGEIYGGPITLSGPDTETDIRAYAARDGMQDSAVARGCSSLSTRRCLFRSLLPAEGRRPLQPTTARW